MNTDRRHPSAFTLLELIFVMVILAIAAAMVVPSLHAFAVGRQTDNAVSTVLGLANYARVHSISEGRVYRLNFDTHANTLNVTVQNNGVFEAPKNDFGSKFSMPDGVRLDVNVTPQPMVTVVAQQNNTQQNLAQTAEQPTLPFGQPLAQQNSIVPNARDNGVYIEFQPTGRVDPVLVKLTDKLGKVIEIGCQTSTETLHVLGKSEMQ
jgi:prepilin-type N-terminal cleavage/methylation domain-containing protein